MKKAVLLVCFSRQQVEATGVGTAEFLKRLDMRGSWFAYSGCYLKGKRHNH